MSARASVFDFTPGQLRRTRQRLTDDTAAAAQPPAGVLDDFVDCVEAVHQCANRAGFSVRPRAFIFALATAAHKSGGNCVKLFDKELGDLQGCSARTVQRQRRDYLGEARRLRFDLIEVVEGEYNHQTGENEPTLYRFTIGETVERIVSEARASIEWEPASRQAQREAIRRAAEAVFDEIPEAPPKRRKRKQPRSPLSELETRKKIIETQLAALRQIAEKIVTGPDLAAWWDEQRAQMDAFLGADSPQDVER